MRNFSLKTKGNFHPNSKRGRIVRIGLVTVVLCCVLVVGGKLFGTVVSYVVFPVYEIKRWVAESTAPFPVLIRSRMELLHEIDALKEKISAQGGSDATIARLTTEVNMYRELMAVGDTDARIAAGVIARPPELPYDLLLIDRGSNDGIAHGAVVYHAEDRAIGFVSKIFPGSSLVTLFSSPGVTATAYLFGPDIFVETYGEGGGVVRLSIPQGITVTPGDAVVMPGIGAGILGVVRDVSSVATEPEQRAYVTISAPIQSLYAVGVSSRAFEILSYEDAASAVSAWDYHDFTIAIPERPTTTPPTTATST